MRKLTILAGGKSFAATLSDSPAADAFIKMLPMTVYMTELNGNEKYCFLKQSLPGRAERPREIQPGELMLFGGDCLVLFYKGLSTSYSYTRLGKLDDQSGLASALGKGSAQVTFKLD